MMEEPINQYKPGEKLELNEVIKPFAKVFKKVCCPSCEEEVNADNLNLQNNVAKCGGCNVIFSIEEEVESVKSKKEMKQETFRPEGIDLFFYKEDLDIIIQQHIQGLDAVFIYFLPIIACFSIFLYFVENFSIYIPAALTLGALYFVFKGLTYSKNKTFIDINDKFLSIKSRPKNFQKDKIYPTAEIDQLYLKQAADGIGYSIYLITNSSIGQKHQKLINVNTLSKAKYLEQEIERYLNIKNRKVLEATV